MKSVIKEGLRYLVQIVFGCKCFDGRLASKVRTGMYRMAFGNCKMKYVGAKVLIHCCHLGLNATDAVTRPGVVRIGKSVCIGERTEIDYSGSVEIYDNVEISTDVKIFTHIHKLCSNRIAHDKSTIYSTKLVIEENATIGAEAIILPGVDKIGAGAVIDSGCIVTKNVGKEEHLKCADTLNMAIND